MSDWGKTHASRSSAHEGYCACIPRTESICTFATRSSCSAVAFAHSAGSASSLREASGGVATGTAEGADVVAVGAAVTGFVGVAVGAAVAGFVGVAVGTPVGAALVGVRVVTVGAALVGVAVVGVTVGAALVGVAVVGVAVGEAVGEALVGEKVGEVLVGEAVVTVGADVATELQSFTLVTLHTVLMASRKPSLPFFRTCRMDGRYGSEC